MGAPDEKPDTVRIRTNKDVLLTKPHPKTHEILGDLREELDNDCMALYETEFLNPQLHNRFKDSDEDALHLAAAMFKVM